MTWLILLAVLAPFLALPIAAAKRLRWLMPIAAVPALMIALVMDVGVQLDLSWLLLGSTLGLSGNDKLFLFAASIIWFAASIAVVNGSVKLANPPRFCLWFLLAMSGNFLLVLGQDAVSFYLGFSLMGLASYGLVIHKGDPDSLYAGRIYLVMTLVAEVLLFSALLMFFSRTGELNPLLATHEVMPSGLEMLLFILSLGIKGGMFGLHSWLPLAHPAAPAPASAVLSGVMIKSALLGWSRYLPIGVVALPNWGSLFIAMAMLGLLWSLFRGLCSSKPKVVLAYSSISKMSVALLLVGSALLLPAYSSELMLLLAMFGLYHGLSKAALFLGAEASRYSLIVLLPLLYPILTLAGAPATFGPAFKAEVSPFIKDASDLALISPYWLLQLSAVTSAMLMFHLTWLLIDGQQKQRSANTAWVPILLLLFVAITLPFWLAPLPEFSLGVLVPLLLAAVLVWFWHWGGWVKTVPTLVSPKLSLAPLNQWVASAGRKSFSDVGLELGSRLQQQLVIWRRWDDSTTAVLWVLVASLVVGVLALA